MGADHVDGHSHVLSVGGHLHEDEAHGIGAVAVDDVAWVDTITEALGHLLAVTVLDHGVNEDVEVRKAAIKEIAVEHHHAADPQGDYVA